MFFIYYRLSDDINGLHEYKKILYAHNVVRTCIDLKLYPIIGDIYALNCSCNICNDYLMKNKTLLHYMTRFNHRNQTPEHDVIDVCVEKQIYIIFYRSKFYDRFIVCSCARCVEYKYKAKLLNSIIDFDYGPEDFRPCW